MPTEEQAKLIESIIEPLKDTSSGIILDCKEAKNLNSTLKQAAIKMYNKPKTEAVIKEVVDTSISFAIVDGQDKIIVRYKDKKDLEQIYKIIEQTLRNIKE